MKNGHLYGVPGAALEGGEPRGMRMRRFGGKKASEGEIEMRPRNRTELPGSNIFCAALRQDCDMKCRWFITEEIPHIWSTKRHLYPDILAILLRIL